MAHRGTPSAVSVFRAEPTNDAWRRTPDVRRILGGSEQSQLIVCWPFILLFFTVLIIGDQLFLITTVPSVEFVVFELSL
jgi:hypothetical protein